MNKIYEDATDTKSEDNASWLMMSDAEFDKWNSNGSVVEQVKANINDQCDNGFGSTDHLIFSVY